jgi:hypothetical protein
MANTAEQFRTKRKQGRDRRDGGLPQASRMGYPNRERLEVTQGVNRAVDAV